MELQAPSIVAIVIGLNPDLALEETLESLVSCDYPNLSILVVDASPNGDLEPVIARHAPDAFVRSASPEASEAEALNDAARAVEGAAFLWYCRPGAILAPDALSTLVQEAFRSNAAVLVPKLLDRTVPGSLLSVGLAVDRAGMIVNRLEPGELDQSQHDAVKEVFAAEGSAFLVRADLFSEVGGLETCVGSDYASVEFCWRARLAGARVVVVPSARIEITPKRLVAPAEPEPDAPDAITTSRADSLTAALICTSASRLPLAVVDGVIGSVLETVAGLGTGHPERLEEEFRAWKSLIGKFGSIRRGRRRVRRLRVIKDCDLDPVRASGIHLGRSAVRAGVDPHGLRLVLATTVLLLLELYAARRFWSGPLPHVGGIVSGASPSSLWGQFVTGWRSVGVGSGTASPPPGLAILAVLGWLTFGHAGALIRVGLALSVPVGTVGAGRATRAFGISGWPRFLASVAYAASALPYDLIDRGDLPSLLTYALLPWLIVPLLALWRPKPDASGSPAGTPPVSHWRGLLSRRTLGQAVGLALLSAAAPVILFAYAIFWIGWAIGIAVAGAAVARERSRAGEVLLRGGAVLLGAFVLLLPGSLQFLRYAVGPGFENQLSFSDLIRFHVGPLGAGPVGFAVAVAAAAVLVIGRDYRRNCGVALWVTAILALGVAAILENTGHFGLGAGAVLVTAAIAWALAVGLAGASFRLDLPTYGFGWRHGIGVIGSAALVLACIPVLANFSTGRFDLPKQGMAATLTSSIGTSSGEGDFRVLWIGQAPALAGPYWPLTGDLMFGLWNGTTDTEADVWPTGEGPALAAIRSNLLDALDGRTRFLGHLLADDAIAYVAVSTSPAPADLAAEVYPVPAGLVGELEAQSDLLRLPADPNLILFQNPSAFPLRSELAAAGNINPQERDPRVLQFESPAVGSRRVLGASAARSSVVGQLAPGRLFLSEIRGWRLEVNHDQVPSDPAFTFGRVFDVTRAGRAQLYFPVSDLRWATVLLEGALWLTVAGFLFWPLIPGRERQR
jgi:hypothetical protein